MCGVAIDVPWKARVVAERHDHEAERGVHDVAKVLQDRLGEGVADDGDGVHALGLDLVEKLGEVADETPTRQHSRIYTDDAPARSPLVTAGSVTMNVAPCPSPPLATSAPGPT